MTITEEERTHWGEDRAKIDQYVDTIIALIKYQGAEPVAYMAMDLVFRPYLKWLQTAYVDNVNPTLVRNSMVNAISIMIMETATRMTGREVDGSPVPIENWLGELVLDLRDELIHDLDTLGEQRQNH